MKIPALNVKINIIYQVDNAFKVNKLQIVRLMIRIKKIPVKDVL